MQAFEVDGDIATIVITQRSGVVWRVVIDASDVKLVSGYRWKIIAKSKRLLGRLTGKRGDSRYIYRILTGASPDMDVDHINGDVLDNRRVNLRVVAHSANQQNRRHGYGDKALPRGVGLARRGRNTYFRVEHKLNGKAVHGGYFKTLEGADFAAKKWRTENMPFSEEGDEPWA